MLTRKQLQLLEFIHKRVQRDGVPPSFDEMKEALDLRSKSGIHRLITALEERGFIRRLAHRARAIEIVKLPDAMDPGAGFVPQVIDGDGGSGEARRPANARPVEVYAVELPVMGRIAAGVPIEAISQVSHNVAVPGQMLSGNHQHYALEVKGELDDRRRHKRWRRSGDPRRRDGEQRRDRGRPGRGAGGDAEALSPAGRIGRVGSREFRLRDANLSGRPGQDPGSAGRTDQDLLATARRIAPRDFASAAAVRRAGSSGFRATYGRRCPGDVKDGEAVRVRALPLGRPRQLSDYGCRTVALPRHTMLIRSTIEEAL